MAVEIDRNILKNRFLIEGTVILDSALHIGGGKQTLVDTDSPIVKTPDGLPYIPGSSFKGIFRSATEKLASTIDSVRVCFLTDESVCLTPKPKQDLSEKEKEYIKQGDTKFLEENLCDICKLFGSPYLASKIFFKDLYLDSENAWAGLTEIRDGVVIDRDSERARNKLKYDFEVVPVGARFAMRIDADNLSEKEEALIGITLMEFKNGFGKLGGNKTRGTGNFHIENASIKKVDFTDKGSFLDYLTKGEEGMKEVTFETVGSLIQELLENKEGENA